ncbi:hypothetical protein FPHOBKDP_00168 [Listeria phage LPJP1]|nr:hypothetical protein FPHOBKDP_00168 [Listeria phage LPJP1]
MSTSIKERKTYRNNNYHNLLIPTTEIKETIKFINILIKQYYKLYAKGEMISALETIKRRIDNNVRKISSEYSDLLLIPAFNNIGGLISYVSFQISDDLDYNVNKRNSYKLLTRRTNSKFTVNNSRIVSPESISNDIVFTYNSPQKRVGIVRNIDSKESITTVNTTSNIINNRYNRWINQNIFSNDPESILLYASRKENTTIKDIESINKDIRILSSLEHCNRLGINIDRISDLRNKRIILNYEYL